MPKADRHSPVQWIGRNDGERGKFFQNFALPATVLALGAVGLVCVVMRIISNFADFGDAQWPASLRNVLQVVLLVLGSAAILQLVFQQRIRTVAWHTFAQCIRMKVAVAFVVMLAAALSVLPFLMKGDGTLAGGIRTFLSYSVSITGGLLSIVTVLVAASVISGDVREKYIFLLAAKPLARWQYILGRWLGVVMLNAVLLGIAAVAIFMVLQHMRETPAESAIDRRTIETEIFTARQEVLPESPDFEAWVRQHIRKLKKENRYQAVIEDFQAQGNLTLDQSHVKLVSELLKQAHSEYETAGPYGMLAWRFRSVRLEDTAHQAGGKVLLAGTARRLFRIAAPPGVVGKLIYGGPVRVNGVRGRVRGQTEDYFDVEFTPEDMKRGEISNLRKDMDAQVLAEPTFQFRYKAKPVGRKGDQSLYRGLRFYRLEAQGSAEKGFKPVLVYAMRGDGPVKSLSTVTVPAEDLLSEGAMMVVYRNVPKPSSAAPIPPPGVRIVQKDVSILYRVGGFEWNYFRSVLLVFIQLVFLAALGVFFGSFLSFPVASMACMVLLGSGLLLGWLAESLVWGSKPGMPFDPINLLGNIVVAVVQVLMPNLAETSPGEKLVDGLFISWPTVISAAVMAVAVRVTFYLALGCLIFHKRELARVQV